jgi:dTDP-4-dehydrorhamnose reductase
MKKILINGNNYVSSYFSDFPEKYDVISKLNLDSDFYKLNEKYHTIVNFYEILDGDFINIFNENYLYAKELSHLCKFNHIKFIQISTADFYNKRHDWKSNVETNEQLNIHNDYMLSKRVSERYLEHHDDLIIRIRGCFDDRFHPDNWLVKTYKKDKISNMVDTRTYIPDLKKFLEFSTKENLKGIYNFVQEGTGSDLYFFSSVLKVDKFSHLDPHDNTPEQVLTFEKDQSLDCCDVNCSKLLQIYPHMIDLKAAVLICWENIKDKLTKDH